MRMGGTRFDNAQPRRGFAHATRYALRNCKRRVESDHLSGTSFRTFNQEVFENEFALAGVERPAAAKARHITLGRRPWRGFKSDYFVLGRADRAME